MPRRSKYEAILTTVVLILKMISCVSSKSPSDMMPKRDHERDLELDKKIEALRRKNEALMKRYKVRTSACRQQKCSSKSGCVEKDG